MKIKGTAVKSIPEYVKMRFPEQFNSWIESLPFESQKIFTQGIVTSNWYDLGQAVVMPTKKVGEIFFLDTRKGAWDSGRFSALQALSGIYSMYVKYNAPEHIIERASRVFSAYYESSEMGVVNSSKKSVELTIKNFENIHEVVEFRIGGWIEKALEITGCKDIHVEIKSAISKGAGNTVYKATWN